MPGAQPRRSPVERLASSVRRGAPVGAGAPGVSRVRRQTTAQAGSGGGKEWLVEGVVEDVAAENSDYPYFVWDETKTC